MHMKKTGNSLSELTNERLDVLFVVLSLLVLVFVLPTDVR